MMVSILSSRDSVPNIVFTMTFDITFGPPSHVYCVYSRKEETTKIPFFDVRDDITQLSRKIIRSYYGSDSQPDMTRVSVKVDQPIKEKRTYECEVTVEGIVNIAVSGILALDKKGNGLTSVTITGKRLIAILLVLVLLLSVAGTPTNVTASRTGYTSVLVSWTAPSPPPAGYEVFYQTSDDTRLSGGNTSNTELTLTGLTLEKTYYILVVGFGEEGAPVFPSSLSNTTMIMLRESL